MTQLHLSGPLDAGVLLLLAHGAGAGYDSPFMAQMAERLGSRGVRVARFEFAYMAARRATGKRRPAPKAELLDGEYRAAVDAAAAVAPGTRIAIGGKSMGGRVASQVAGALHAEGRIAGLVCLGYPFHPPKLPEKLRTAHLAEMRCPTLIVQGERDPFGSRAEVEALGLPPSLRFHWARDGDHDLGPRGGSGTTRRENLDAAADAVAAFLMALA